jgi:ribosomal-protein-alanine N-acetyltransferase
VTVLQGALCRLRPYRANDLDALVETADDPLVTRWMTAGFPHPYRRADGETWLALAMADDPPLHFVIEADDAFAGAIGILPQRGEHAGCAIFGYWLGSRFWGRGLATDAARTMAHHALRDRGLRRLEASVFAPNAASARVLEKAGFTLEGRMRQSYIDREGTISDALLYSRLATDPDPRPSTSSG